VVLKRLKIIHKLYLAFGIIIIFMLLVLGYTYMNFLKVSQVVDVNFSAYQIMRESDGILNSIVNIETGSRGYTITGNERDLQSYNDGKTNFIVHYNALKLLSSKNKEQQSILEDFSKKYKIWIEIQSDIIAKKRLEIYRDQNFEIAKPPKSKPSQLPNDSRNSADLVGSGRDSGVMNNLQVILKNINNEEKRSLGIESVNLKITKTKTYLSIVLGGLITTILAILISFFTELSITNPIKMLINATENITKRNYQEPINFKTDRDLGVLIMNFNSMQMAIQSREEDLKKKNKAIEIKMTEANEAIKLKSRFLANMSHELRTPLNSIIGFTTRVIKKSGEILPTVQLENLEIVKEEGYHLLQLINNLMDYSKIEAGKMRLEIETFNLKKVIEEVNNMIKPLLEKKNLEYKYELKFNTSENILMESDRIKIKQILINLLSNAINYSEKGLIKLSILIGDKSYSLKVEDQGIGIAIENINYIFEEFRQVDGSNTRKVGGTGLGLSITKNFVELLGGKIEVVSTLGSGSCFNINLPIEIPSGEFAYKSDYMI